MEIMNSNEIAKAIVEYGVANIGNSIVKDYGITLKEYVQAFVNARVNNKSAINVNKA
jgi:hypothetical protein